MVLSRNVLLVLAIIATPLLAWAFALVVATPPTTGDSDDLARSLIIGYVAVSLTLGLVSFVQLFQTRVGFFLLMATHIIWFALPAAATLAEGRWWGDIARYRLSSDAIIKATLIVGFFLLMNLLGYLIVARRALLVGLDPPEGAPTRAFLPQLTVVMGVFLAFGVIPYVVFGGSLGEIISNIAAGRTEVKPWTQGAHVVSDYGPALIIGRSSLVTFSALGLWLVVARDRYKFSRLWTTALAGAAVLGLLVTFFDSGTRTWTLIIIGPALLGLFVYRLRDRNVVRGTLIAAGAMLVAVALVQFQRLYRFTGNLDAMEASGVIELNDNDFFTETAVAINLVPRFGYLEQFEPILYLSNVIPRSIWQEKPYSQTLRYYSLGRSGFDEYLKTGTSRMPSIVGQHYMSWGMTGVVVAGLLWGAMFGGFERVFRRATPMSLSAFFGALGLIFLFTSARGLYPGFHYPLVLTALLLWYERITLQRQAPVPYAGAFSTKPTPETTGAPANAPSDVPPTRSL